MSSKTSYTTTHSPSHHRNNNPIIQQDNIQHKLPNTSGPPLHTSYVGKETLYITNTFRHTHLKIAFHTNNTLESLLNHRNLPTDKFALSGVYKLTCPDCNKAYVGQTGRCFSYVTKNTKVPSTTIAILLNSHNTSMRNYIPLAPSATLCSCCITREKRHI